MHCGMIERHSRICGRSQGYRGLPIRDEIIVVKDIGPVSSMLSAWLPTPDELARLNAGASIHVRILGVVPPPMDVAVGPLPEGEPIILAD